MTKVNDMKRDLYHEKFLDVMTEWIGSKENRVEGKYYVLTLKDERFIRPPKATVTIGIWSIRDIVVRLMIRLAWFYKYPYSLEALIRRIEILDDKVFYVIPGDVVKVLEYIPWKKVLRKDEVKIEKLDDIFRLLDEISRYFSDDVKIDIGIIIENLKNYESYVEY
jgi:hypothetical protein